MKFPDYSYANLNLLNSILKHYNVETKRNGLSQIDELLNTKKYKKILFLIMDGMGHHNIKYYDPNCFLAKNDYGPISTIFPSTTAAVMTMYESNLPVYESGWMSWSSYFKNINTSIDLFTGRNSLSQEIVNYDYKKLISYKSIYKMIREVNPDLDIYQLYPEKINKEIEPCIQLKYATNVELFEKLTNILIDKEEKFVFAYCDQPDAAMHKFGPSSKEVKLIMDELNDLICLLSKNIDEETLILISADHGQVDISKTYYLNEYEDIMSMLVMPPVFEGRVRSFFVKKEYLNDFKAKFLEYFGDDFILVNKEDVFDSSLYGDGDKHPVFEDTIGDFLAIAVKNAILDYKSPFLDDVFVFKGHHAGLTKEEMEVPLIVLKKE